MQTIRTEIVTVAGHRLWVTRVKYPDGREARIGWGEMPTNRPKPKK